MAVETLSHWDGPDGERWAAEAERYDRMSRRFGDAILEVLDAQPGEHVLDVGCGNGALTIAVAAAVGPDGSATGLDISPQMLAVAARRAREAALPNARVLLADAQEVDLPPGSFDALISRFGVMFFEDPVAAFRNLKRTGGQLRVIA